MQNGYVRTIGINQLSQITGKLFVFLRRWNSVGSLETIMWQLDSVTSMCKIDNLKEA